MARRVTLPGADELFRTTSGAPQAEPDATTAGAHGEDGRAAARSAARDRRPAGGAAGVGGGDPSEPGAPVAGGTDRPDVPTDASPPPANQLGNGATGRRHRRPSGRERHDEKITVYVSADELVDLEAARLALRARHGLAVDRGRIVREALAVVLADLDAHGPSSELVRRLSSR